MCKKELEAEFAKRDEIVRLLVSHLKDMGNAADFEADVVVDGVDYTCKLISSKSEKFLNMIPEILQAIYDSEINYAIYSPCWDAGFTVQLGGEYDKNKPQYDGFKTFVEAVWWLVNSIFLNYPESTFTKNYKQCLDNLWTIEQAK